MYHDKETAITMHFNPEEIKYLEEKLKREIESDIDLYQTIKSLIGLGN